ncbi:helix-turn-helix domain-containing protein [Streptomyces sp. NPDC087422]|uniref:helix-turn-helix domain-containing protein n=1 Tax=Streptomyces sp. NPDC087422 TaxID=3365786 RepID=UPI0038013C65
MTVPTPQADASLSTSHSTVIERKWYTTAEVADMLGFGLSKTKTLVLTGEIRSVRIGRNRRILPTWVDEYVARVVASAEQVAA